MKERTIVTRPVIVAYIGTLLLTTTFPAGAAEDLGAREYANNCAVCHGANGKGGGPFQELIETRIPDLTTLQKRNNGVFPFNRVYEMIDGREVVKAHGPSDMPVWGNEYNAKAVEYYMDYGRSYDAEGFVRGRILALINRIYMLQEK